MSGLDELRDTRHEYRLKGYSAYPVVLAVVIAVLVPWIYFIDGVAPAALVGLLSIIGAILLLFGMQQSRLVIDGSRIETRGMRQNRSADLSEIAGYRTYSSRNGTYRVLCMKDGNRPIRFSQYATDGAFDSWLQKVPDLDRQDREQILQEISADQELGATPEDRLAALARAKQLNIGLWIVAAAAAGFLWGGPAWRTVAFWAVAAAPLVAAVLLMREPLLYAIFKRKKDPRAELSPVLFISGFAFLFFIQQVNFVAPMGLMSEAALVALLWVALFWRPASRSIQPGGAMVAVVLAGLLYAWGVTAGANVALDDVPAVMYRTYVVGKYTVVTHGRGSSTTYHLRLGPWGPFTNSVMSMRVPHRLYSWTQVHDTVCINLHPGWLHAPWYEAVPCSTGTEP